MASYNNFKNNDLSTKSNTDIYNPSFASNVKKNENKVNSFDKNLEKWIYFCQWSKFYPDLFYDLISPETGKMRLDLDQRMFLRAMCRFLSTYAVMPRGYGKTLIELMAIYHTCIFYPDITISMTAQTKENASSISEDKHRELMKFFPLLQNEITDFSFTKNGAEVEFSSGAVYNVLANAQSSKGQRRRRITIEESALLNNDLFKDSLEPIVNVPRRTIGKEGDINPWELNGMINFVTTSGYRGSDEYIRILGMLDDMADLKGKFVLGAGWRLPCYYGRGETESQIMAKKNDPTQSAIRFSQNYESKWVGSADGALINISKLLKLQTINKPELCCHKDKTGKNFELNEYVFGVDVARSNSQSNNKTCVVVLKIIRNTNGVIRQIQVVNIIEPPNGYTLKEQSIVIKRLFYEYGGDLDLTKSRVKAIVIDGNVIGKGLIDRLCEEVTDPDTNRELGCFASINSDVHCDNPDAPLIIYDLTAQGINGDIITKFMDYVETEKLKLLRNFEEIQNKIPEKDKVLSGQACLNTKSLIDEVANLKLKKTTNSITVEQTVKKVDKDRYSALVYGLYYISLFLEREDSDNDDDDRDYVWY